MSVVFGWLLYSLLHGVIRVSDDFVCGDLYSVGYLSPQVL